MVNKVLGFIKIVFYYLILGKEEYDNFAEVTNSVDEMLKMDKFLWPIPEHNGLIYNIKLEAVMSMIMVRSEQQLGVLVGNRLMTKK